MKFLTLFWLVLTVAGSCTGKKEESQNLETDQSKPPIEEYETFRKWADYYRQFDPDFTWKNFIKNEQTSLETMSGSVLPVWHPEFPSYYRPLLIYSPDSSQYLDIDSYLWFVIDKNSPYPEIGYAADQEINCIDLVDSTVTRVAFRGPNQRVEDAFWLDNHSVVLLENNEEGTPMVSLLNLNDRLIVYYDYPDSVTTANGYWQNRLEKAKMLLPALLSKL